MINTHTQKTPAFSERALRFRWAKLKEQPLTQEKYPAKATAQIRAERKRGRALTRVSWGFFLAKPGQKLGFLGFLLAKPELPFSLIFHPGRGKGGARAGAGAAGGAAAGAEPRGDAPQHGAGGAAKPLG